MNQTNTQPNNQADIDRDKLCIPIAKKILNIVLKNDLPMGIELEGKDHEETNKKVHEAYEATFLEIKDYLLEEDVLLKDLNYIFSLAFQVLDTTQKKVAGTLDMYREFADCRLWGVKKLRDIRIKTLDEAMKGNFPTPRVPKEDK